MAIMIPNYIDAFTTRGEHLFYNFLQEFAKPDDIYTSWYLPDIEGREPDFILFCRETGLIVFEVKDWSLDHIEQADPHSFILKAGKTRKRFKSPMHQAREYLISILARIKADGRLMATDTAHLGRPKIPFDCGVVFPNMDRADYCRRGLEKVIDPKRVFFRDDLHPGSGICRDITGRCFQEKLCEMFPPRFRFQLTEEEYAHLKQLLFPVVRIEPQQRNACSYIDPSRRVRVLDDRQEAIARKTANGVHLVKGPTGSGKSLILIHKAACLMKYRPKTGKILFLCHNAAMVDCLKRWLGEKGVALGAEGVDVYHIAEFCSKLLERELPYENMDNSSWAIVLEEGIAAAKKSGMKYEAVLIDEGQELSTATFRLACEFLDPEYPNITIALEPSQSTGGKDGPEFLKKTFPDCHIDEISRIYRHTTAIREFALKFLQMKVRLDSCETSGPMPVLVKFQSFPEVAGYMSDSIRSFQSYGEYPLSEMCILYPRHDLIKESVMTPEFLMAELDRKGIMFDWMSRDYRSKRFYDITTERVCLAEIGDVKGLDYACAFLPGLDELQDKETETEIEQLVFAGITRARHRLLIPYIRETPLIRRLLECNVPDWKH